MFSTKQLSQIAKRFVARFKDNRSIAGGRPVSSRLVRSNLPIIEELETRQMLSATPTISLQSITSAAVFGQSGLVSQPIANAVLAVSSHLAKAREYAKAITPAFNEYGSPPSIYYDSNGALHATTRCSSFVSLVWRNAYSSVTEDVLKGLTTSKSPDAEQWYDALAANKTFNTAAGTFALHGTKQVSSIKAGDILASKYTLPDATGHCMIVDQISLQATAFASSIPGVAKVDRWLVKVIDSSRKPHGSTDSRAPTADEGIGTGSIYIYSNSQTGQLVGWTWTTGSGSTLYQTVDPNAPDYRPMVAGNMTGPGI